MNWIDRGGVAIVSGLLGRALEAEILAEARERFEQAERFVTHGRNLEWRGGEPSRKYQAAPAGPLQYQVFVSKAMREAISETCGFAVKLSGAGSYSYYYETGDYLALHRDIERCEVATITCLEDDGLEARGGLRAYPEYAGRPLLAIYDEHPRGLDLPTRPGDTIIIAGGIIPHEVTPIVAGQRRAVLLACYAMA